MTLVRRDRGSGHTYWADGQQLPGVTTILKQLPKDALIEWAGRTTAEYAVDHWDDLADLKPSERLKKLNKARYEERDQAARKGVKVHQLAEALAADREVSVPEYLAGHVDSYLRFLREWDPDPVAMELVVCNRQVIYCGTADLVAHMAGQVWMLDIKTGRSGIWPEAAAQVCAYARAETYTTAGEDGAEHPLADLGITRCGALHVRADGYDLRPLDSGDQVWLTFRHLAWLHHHADEMASWVGDAIFADPEAA